MTKSEVKQRIDALRKEIAYHSWRYHVLDSPEISDAQWDSLKHELADLERAYPEYISKDSPTQRVEGKALEKFEKVRHILPMRSLADAFSIDEVRDWEQRNNRVIQSPSSSLRKKGKGGKLSIPTRGSASPELQRGEGGEEGAGDPIDYYCELKIDGLAIALSYDDGVFLEGSTRGDGVIGENVTMNLRTVGAIPLRLREHADVMQDLNKAGLVHVASRVANGLPSRIEARGEVFMTKRMFAQLNAERARQGEEPFANPRNVAAGSVRQLDPGVTASRRLDSYAYALVTDLGQQTHEEEHLILAALGFKTNAQNKRVTGLEGVDAYHEHIGRIREKLDFEIDGVVVIVNDRKAFERLGVAGKSPRGGLAYKFAAREATTVVDDIRVQVGRTGAITPVAHLRPVNVGGVMVSRATLHNEDEIKRLGVKIGDTVAVVRAGDVIPDVKSVMMRLRTGKEKNFHMPDACPVCGDKVVRPPGEVVHRCVNPGCPAKTREGLYHFVSRGAFDIMGLGPKSIDQLVDQHLVTTPADFFMLTEGDMLPLERFAETSAKKLIASIQSRKRVPFAKFLYALGIRHVGEETAIDLAEAFGTLEKLQEASQEEINEVHEVGRVMAKSIYEWLHDPRNKKLLKDLQDAGISIVRPLKRKIPGNLSGKTFVLTGGLAELSRDEAKMLIRNAGADISESVSKKTDYVVVGSDPGSKFDKAKKLGVTILTEKEFLALLGG